MFSNQLNAQVQQQMSFLHNSNMAKAMASKGGPSATTSTGTRIQCSLGQNLNVGTDGSASCSQPVDKFAPALSMPPMGLIPRPGHW